MPTQQRVNFRDITESDLGHKLHAALATIFQARSGIDDGWQRQATILEFGPYDRFGDPEEFYTGALEGSPLQAFATIVNETIESVNQGERTVYRITDTQNGMWMFDPEQMEAWEVTSPTKPTHPMKVRQFA